MNLISKQQDLNDNIFNYETTLPLDYETTSAEELAKGYIRVDVDTSKYVNMEELKKAVVSVWDERTSQFLLYFQNGVTYHFQKNPDLGGITTTDKLVNANPFYVEENGVLYSTAFNEYDKEAVSQYISPKNYFIEIERISDKQCVFKKWFRNPNYGIKNEYKYTEEFIYYEALLVKNNNNQWVFGYIFNNPEEYAEFDTIESFYDNYLISSEATCGFKNKF